MTGPTLSDERLAEMIEELDGAAVFFADVAAALTELAWRRRNMAEDPKLKYDFEKARVLYRQYFGEQQK